MNREALLAGGIVAVIAAALLVAALVPGVIAEPSEEVVRPGPVAVEELTIAHGQVTGATATLAIDARLAHRGNPTGNVTLLLRATDADSGMVETTRTVEVGTLRGDREVAVPANLTVAREGGYRVEAILYRDGDRIDSTGTEVRGVGSLTPAYAETAVEFHRFDADLPAIEYAITDADGNRTTLDVSAYLTNTGDDPAGDLELRLVARQADSNIVADRATVDVGEIRPGRTASPSASLSVPEGYNYYLDAVLWKDGVVVGTARSAANLDPTETLPVNETTREVGLEVSDFEQDDRNRQVTEEPARTESADGQPGFGLAVAIVAVLGAALLYSRRSP